MGAALTVIKRLHNPRGRECGCVPECWCQRTAAGRLLRWYLPRSHQTSATPEWKRAQEAICDGADRSRTLQHHATVLLVESVADAVAYYRDALGFEIEPYENLPEHYAFARRDHCSVHFAHWNDVEPRPNSAVVPPDMFDLYVYVEDVDGLSTPSYSTAVRRSSKRPPVKVTGPTRSASATRTATSWRSGARVEVLSS